MLHSLRSDFLHTKMPTSKNKSVVPVSRLVRWYLSHFRGDQARIITGVTLALLQSAVLVPIPLIFRQIIDVEIPAARNIAIVWWGVLAAGLYLLHAGLSFGSTTLTLLATKRVTEQLRARLCMQLQQMSLRFHDVEKASELHSRVTMDTERIDIMGNAVIVHVVSSVIMFTVAIVLLGMMSPTLLGVVSLMLPVYFFTHRSLKKRLSDVHRNFRDQMETMNAQVNDLLQSIRLVKTFAREEHEQQRAERQFSTVTRSALAMTIFNAFFGSLMGFLSHIAVLVLYVAGGVMIIRQTLTVGELVAFVGMVGFLIQPLNTLINLSGSVYAGLASLAPVYTLLHFNEPLEVIEGKRAVNTLKGHIRFRDVSLVFESNGRHALHHIDVEIHPGETIALVGESGAGKSTFANLVLGFYFASSGAVEIDGVDIRDLNVRQLRERIGVVSQDNVVLNTTIRENLMYGRMSATEEQMREASRNAHADDFIMESPGGYDTIVGDRGVRISGGQRQRLAIARALLKDPQILILDEATSALDSDSESKIQDALERLQANRTCIVIAHRLSTIMNADRILVLRQGNLVEVGTHGELLKRNGEYARLCEKQFGKVAKDLELMMAR